MQVLPYLNFSGECRKAFDFYQQAIGGEITYAVTYGESPMRDDVPAEGHDQIMHISLELDELHLMGADGPPAQAQPSGDVMINLMVDDNAEAERIFAALSQDAQNIMMPMQETFWAHRFGMFTDQFGKCWMIMHGKSEGAQ